MLILYWLSGLSCNDENLNITTGSVGPGACVALLVYPSVTHPKLKSLPLFSYLYSQSGQDPLLIPLPSLTPLHTWPRPPWRGTAGMPASPSS